MDSDRLIEAIETLFRVNLGIKKDERTLVCTDIIKPEERITLKERNRRERLRDLARLVAETGREYAREITYAEYKALMFHGYEPPEKLWRMAFGDHAVNEMKDAGVLNAILSKKSGEEQTARAEKIISANRKDAVSVVIGLSNYSTSHTRFRDFLTRIAGTRYASMPLFDPDMFFGSMTVDWRALERKTKDLAKKVNKALWIEISTPNGTILSSSKKGRKAGIDTGIITKAGSFSNLPAGEVYLAPLEGTSKGRLVIEWAQTHKLRYPVTLIVDKGKVIEVKGKDSYAGVIKRKLKENDDFRNIAEIGIGTNDKATRPDNILESEKIAGTIHVALGDNSSFGGKVRTPFHQDFIFFHPTLRLIYRDKREEAMLDNGRIVYTDSDRN